jgi:hypothetical protein
VTPAEARELGFNWNVPEQHRMRLLLVFALLLTAAVVRADSLADLRQPSSTIPGCVNDWGPLGTGSGVTEPTCEGKAALAEWNEHAAAVNTARDLIVQASNQPDRSDPQAVINALHACAAAADAMTRLYHPAQPRPRDLSDVLAWMRPWFERRKLPIPDSIGAAFRTLAGILAQPDILRQDRIAIYGQAAVFATRESELAAELGGEVERQTDTAARAAHTAALEAARAAENGRAQPDPAASIAAAAGPGHQAVAQEQIRQLNQSLAANPNQDGYAARTGRDLAAVPNVFLWIGGIALFLVIVGFRPLAARLGPASAVRASVGTGEHLQGRSLLTPDEVMRLGPARPIVMIAGEPPYLLDRINYLTDPAYAGRFDPNPMHLQAAAQ